MLDRNLAPARYDDNPSPWPRSFSLSSMKVLVVCRGPVRQEAFESAVVNDWMYGSV